MRELILHPTDTSQWQALLHEAQGSANIMLNEDTESYLVFLLMRYMQNPELIESIIALDFFESMKSLKSQQLELLQGVGDKSLLFCSLFPGIAEKRRVSIEYFSDMGKAAYCTMGELHEQAVGALYAELGQEFTNLCQILTKVRV